MANSSDAGLSGFRAELDGGAVITAVPEDGGRVLVDCKGACFSLR